MSKPAEFLKGHRDAQSVGDVVWQRLAFYNIGWNHESKKPHHTKEHLAREICAMVKAKALGAVGISEVFNLKDKTLHDERLVIMQYLLLQLNGSAAQPASSNATIDFLSLAQHAWRGKCDGHYIFVWDSNKLDL